MLLKQLSIEQMIINHNVRVKYGYPKKKIILKYRKFGSKNIHNKLFLRMIPNSHTILVDLKMLKNTLQIASLGFSRRSTKVQCYYGATNAFQLIFWVKYIVRRVTEVCKSWMPCFSC